MILTLLLSTGAWAYPLSSTEEILTSTEKVYETRMFYEKCNHIYSTAENMMQQRQLGETKENLLALIDDVNNFSTSYPVEWRVIQRKMVGMAYMYPYYDDEKKKKLAVIDFQNKMFLMCDSKKM